LSLFFRDYQNPTPSTTKDKEKYWLLSPTEILDNSCWGK